MINLKHNATHTAARSMSLNAKSVLLYEDEQDFQYTSTSQSTIFSSINSVQNNPEDITDVYCFPERLYNKIEDFLDSQGLYICEQSPVLKSVTLKPSLGFKDLKKMHSLILKAEPISSLAQRSSSDKKEFEFKAIPKFLAKRTYSSHGA